MFIWAVETGLSIARDIIEQDSVEKISNFEKKIFSICLDLGGGSRVGKGWSFRGVDG